MVKKRVAVFALIALLSLLAGCVVQSAPAAAANTITMGPNNYIGGVGGGSSCGTSTNPCTITIKKGQTITFTDDKNTGTPHILVIGMSGTPKNEAGAPDFNGSTGTSFQPGGPSWTSPPWNTPGMYDVSCTIHPATMNLKVTVAP